MIRKALGVAVLSASVLVSAVAAQAATGPEEGHDPALADKIRRTRDIIQDFSGSTNGIPHEILKDAKAIVIISNAIRVGFVFAGEHGRGVAVYKNDAGEWGTPAFFRMTNISFGFQAGGEVDDVILVLKTERALEGLLSHAFTIGMDFTATAGPLGREAKAATNINQAEVYVYGRNHGFFAGFSLDGAVIHEDMEANSRYYGEHLTARQILLENAGYQTKPGTELAESLRTATGGAQPAH